MADEAWKKLEESFEGTKAIKGASEWSGVLSSQRVYAAVRSAKRVAKAGHHLYL
jgi:hypothetical protein